MSSLPEPILFNKFNAVGVGHNKYSDAYHKIVGLDIHTDPGALIVAQALVKDSADINEPCLTLFCTNGNSYHFSTSTGKIWQRDPSGVVVLVYTTVPTSGSPACVGVDEYQSYIYWATSGFLHRIPVSNATGVWSTGLAPNWDTFINATEHPMKEVNDVLYMTDGDKIDQVDAGAFTSNAFDLPVRYQATCLCRDGTNLVIGTKQSSLLAPCGIFVWDTYTGSFTFEDDIPEVSIQSIIQADNIVLIFPNKSHYIYYLNGDRAEIFTRIPFANSIRSPLTVNNYYPNANVNNQYCAAIYRGNTYIGVSDINSEASGVWIFGRHTPDTNLVFSLQNPVSKVDTDGYPQFNKININSICVADHFNSIILFVSWTDTDSGLSYLDVTSPTQRYTKAYIDTKLIFPDAENSTTFKKAWADYESLPVGSSIDMKLNKNHSTYGSALTPTIDSDHMRVDYNIGAENTKVVQVRLEFTSDDNNSPKVHQFGIGEQ